MARAQQLITTAGQRCEAIDLPDMVHSMHAHDPDRFAGILTQWSEKLAQTADDR